MRITHGVGLVELPPAALPTVMKTVAFTLLLTVMAGLLGMHALSVAGPAGAPMPHTSALLAPDSATEDLSPGLEPGRADSSVDIPLSSFESSAGVEQVAGSVAPLSPATMLGVMACLIALLGIIVLFVRWKGGGWIARSPVRSGMNIRRPDLAAILLTPSLIALSIDRR